jgi:hypothetical protein
MTDRTNERANIMSINTPQNGLGVMGGGVMGGLGVLISQWVLIHGGKDPL